MTTGQNRYMLRTLRFVPAHDLGIQWPQRDGQSRTHIPEKRIELSGMPGCWDIKRGVPRSDTSADVCSTYNFVSVKSHFFHGTF